MAAGVLRALFAAARVLGRLAATAGRGWAAASWSGRVPLLVLVAGAGLAVAVLPWGVWFVAAGAAGAAVGWAHRDRGRAPWRVDPAAARRLRVLYEGLVPCFSVAGARDGSPLYAPGGSWERCFRSFAFGPDGRLARLRLVYPPYVPDGDAEWRRGVESLLVVRAGGDREYGFRWDGERSELEVTALEPLPAGVCAQRFATGPGEAVLGFSDVGAVERTVPVRGWGGGVGERVEAPVVVWRWGPRSAEPNLLVTGAAGAGATSLVRAVVLQALGEGDVLLVDGCGAGEFACFTGRRGVVAVESEPRGAAAGLEWAARETERRLLAVRRGGGGAGVRPLWIVVDRPVSLGDRARAEGVRDPLELLELPLRYGRAGRVTVVVAERSEELDGLGGWVLGCARARVVLGAVPTEWVGEVLGAFPGSWPLPQAPPGRGYARLGEGPVVRLQAPAAPDPWDEGAGEAARRAVVALLPGMGPAWGRAGPGGAGARRVAGRPAGGSGGSDRGAASGRVP